jgi:hypothetical protein
MYAAGKPVWSREELGRIFHKVRTRLARLLASNRSPLN